MNKRVVILLRQFAAAKVSNKMEEAGRGTRRWLHRYLKRWWAGMDHQTRGEVRRRLELGLPLMRQHFIGAPSQLGRIGAMAVDRPMPWARKRQRVADQKRARKARGRARRRAREQKG